MVHKNAYIDLIYGFSESTNYEMFKKNCSIFSKSQFIYKKPYYSYTIFRPHTIQGKKIKK